MPRWSIPTKEQHEETLPKTVNDREDLKVYREFLAGLGKYAGFFFTKPLKK